MTDYDDADAKALNAAAQYIVDGIKDDSPSGKIASFWRVIHRGGAVYLRNRLIEARMTDTDGRHPVFPHGPRKSWHWANENDKNPSRSRWAERSVLRHADEAQEKFADEWLNTIAIDSDVFDRD